MNPKKGFTIIEVVLVLAVAGLIFIMVFVALPAMQRSQRDTRRASDIQRLVAAVNTYKSNHRNRLPTDAPTSVDPEASDWDTKKDTQDSWAYFYDKYLIVNAAGQTDIFEDPDGIPYKLEVVDGSTASNITQINTATFDSREHKIRVTTMSKCNGELIIESGGPYNFSAAYVREGGGTICMAG